MNVNLLQNLSYSINLPKTTVHSEDVLTAVNEALTKYYFEAHYQDYVTFYNLHKNLFGSEKFSPVMQSEKIILCEINASLWIKAINSAINSITKQTYPHHVVLQQFINYLLNANSDENFGLLQEFLWKLLVTHPPRSEMFDYYWQIMSDYFVVLNDKKTEEQTLLFCLIETISHWLKFRLNSNGKKDLDLPKTKSKFSLAVLNNFNPFASLLYFSLTVADRGLFRALMQMDELCETKSKIKQINFLELPWSEKIERCLYVLNFVYDILESNFIFWLNSTKFKPSFSDSRPLMICLLWHNIRDTGIINNEVHKILNLYELYLQSGALGLQNMQVIEKLVVLLGEVIRCSDGIESIKYPFSGTNCDNFFRELSLIFHQRIVKSREVPKENELIVNFKPSWLRLFLCSHLLSLIIGYQCPCELTGVYDILEHIARIENRSQNVTKTLQKPSSTTNSKLIGKLRKLKSINGKLRNGKTQLHLACEENDVEKITALFTFPELDVNAVDRDGWTALHVAAFKGNIASMQELLSFCPNSRDAQKSVNTRAIGPEKYTPLMCAVSEGHVNVCQMLLEHSGSVLLEDVNELNLTPLELSNKPEIIKVLQYYKSNDVRTLHSHNAISFDVELKEVVLRLCVEMIQAYFCTYRTWDVYKTLKRSKKNSENSVNSDVDYKWDYMRYHRDIKRNIYKLRRLVSELEQIKEFKDLGDIYVRILSFNKMC